MKIGEFSQLTGIPIKTIRYYSDIGLLVPNAVDKDSGYRTYGEQQIKQLNRILSLKEAGFLLKEIAQIMESELPTEAFAAMLEEKLYIACQEEIDCQNKIAHLKSYINQIRKKENKIMKVNLNELKVAMVKPYTVNFTDSYAEIRSQMDTHKLETSETYTLPIAINFTAKTDSTNIRLYYGNGEVIFNWECNPNELRIHDILTAQQYGFENLGGIPVDEFVDILWVIDKDKMILFVDGEKRIELTDLPYINAMKANPDIQIISTVGIGSAFGSCVTVKDISVN